MDTKSLDSDLNLTKDKMDASIFDHHVAGFKKFLKTCSFDRENVFPTYDVQLQWEKAEVTTLLENSQTVSMEWTSNPYSFHPTFFPDGRCPFLDISVSLKLELLPIVDDRTMSFEYHVPLEQAQSLAEFSSILRESASTSMSSSSGQSDSSHEKRKLRPRDNIINRILGRRQQDTRRGLVQTMRQNTEGPPLCVLLTVIKIDGPDREAFMINSAKIQVGHTIELICMEPFEMYALSPHCFAIDSSRTLWLREMVRGLQTASSWIRELSGSADPTDICLTLSIQLNENSFSNLGFPFRLFRDRPVINDANSYRMPHGDNDVPVVGLNGVVYWLPGERLTLLSGYFRAFLTENWNNTSGDQINLCFPVLPPFDGNQKMIEQLVRYFASGELCPSSPENCVDLFIAADILDMPTVTDLTGIACVSFITLDNVTQVIRLAWEYHADYLLRAALLFLKSNYDEVWVNDKKDLEELGALLSNQSFLERFSITSLSF